MLEAGAVVGTDSLVNAARSGNASIVKVLATTPGVMIDAQASVGWALFIVLHIHCLFVTCYKWLICVSHNVYM